jgi:uncharacterized membrane protein
MTDAQWQQQRTDPQLLRTVLNGKGTEMPAFRDKLREDQARSLVASVRALGGHQPGAKYPDADGDDPKGPPEPGFSQRTIGWLGRLHPSTVHFPIGLLLAAAVAELIFLGTGRSLFDATARVCIWFGSLAAAPAAVLGWFLASARSGDWNWILTVHSWLGTSAAAGAAVVLVVSELSRRSGGPGRWTFRLVLFLIAGLILATGFFGGAVVHGLHYYAWPPTTSAP